MIGSEGTIHIDDNSREFEWIDSFFLAWTNVVAEIEKRIVLNYEF